MKTLIIAALVTVGIASTTLAQQLTVRDMMTEMRAKWRKTFDQCQELATSRGYRLSGDNETRRSRGDDVHRRLHHGAAALTRRLLQVIAAARA